MYKIRKYFYILTNGVKIQIQCKDNKPLIEYSNGQSLHSLQNRNMYEGMPS